jgi:hypothetical protein
VEEITRKSFISCFVFTAQDNLGGKIRVMITGAAPISTQVLTFLRAALGCSVRFYFCICRAHYLNKNGNATEKNKHN